MKHECAGRGRGGDGRAGHDVASRKRNPTFRRFVFYRLISWRSHRTCQTIAFSTVAARGQSTAPLACTEHRNREKDCLLYSPPTPPLDHLDPQAHCVLSVASTLFGKDTSGERLLASLSTPGVLWSKSIKHTKDPITTGKRLCAQTEHCARGGGECWRLSGMFLHDGVWQEVRQCYQAIHHKKASVFVVTVEQRSLCSFVLVRSDVVRRPDGRSIRLSDE